MLLFFDKGMIDILRDQTTHAVNGSEHIFIATGLDSIMNIRYSNFPIILEIAELIINQGLIKNKLDDIGIGDFGSFL